VRLFTRFCTDWTSSRISLLPAVCFPCPAATPIGALPFQPRPRNVFGYSFLECLVKTNRILGDLGLPHFSEGQRFITNFKGEPRSVWTGAIITRLDMTQNFQTGSAKDAYLITLKGSYSHDPIPTPPWLE
jgi:hypothetical protein